VYNQHPSFFQHLQYIHQKLQELMKQHQELKDDMEQKVAALKEESQRLTERLDSMKTIQIENINYKIQELTVKELKGTLNIGMTALTDENEIRKWLNGSGADGEIQFQDMENGGIQGETSEDTREAPKS
jgi:regulator of replication initiation timing